MKDIIKICLVKSLETNDNDIDRIIGLKKQHWPHPYSLQKRWIELNIKPDDLNLFIEKQNEIIGFMNLSYIEAFINEKDKQRFLGVGNVCVDKIFSGKGLGLLLMQIANYHIISMGYNGVLLCSDELVGFYKKAGWRNDSLEVFINNDRITSNIMFLNRVDAKTIRLNRSF